MSMSQERPKSLLEASRLPDPNPIVPSLRELILLEGRAMRSKRATLNIRSMDSGRSLSRFKGRGMEYDESRPYAPGDDVRALDWRVTARTGRPHTKLYRDERDRPLILSIDYRQSMWFGTRGMFKSALAARLTALLAWRAHAGGERVGHQLFSEEGLQETPPEGGRIAVLKILKSLVDSAYAREKMGSGDALGLALESLPRHARPGCLIRILSDFKGLETQSEKSLRRLTRHANLEFLIIQDPMESCIPLGRHHFSDGQNDFEVNVDRGFQIDFESRFLARQEHIRQIARKLGIRAHWMRTDESIASIEARVFG